MQTLAPQAANVERLRSLEEENTQIKNDMKSEHAKTKLLEYEINFLQKVNDSNKKLIIDMLDQKQNEYVSSRVKTGNGNSNETWLYPKKYARNTHQEQQSDLKVTNRFGSLCYGYGREEPEQTKGASNVLHVDDDYSADVDTARIDKETTYGKEQPKYRKSGLHFDAKPEKNTILSHKAHSRTVPGNTSYATRTKRGKTIAVVGDSMISGVTGGKLSEELNYGRAFVKPFLGATAQEMTNFYMQPLFKGGGVDSIVLMIGTNNVHTRKFIENDEEQVVNQSPVEIVEEILKLASSCKSKGINDIFINSIIQRNNKSYCDKINEVNILLEQKCKENDYIYIDNVNLNSGYHGDNIHLTYEGKSKNIVNALNSFYDGQ